MTLPRSPTDSAGFLVRWGQQEDDIGLQGSLELIAPNILREAGDTSSWIATINQYFSLVKQW